MDAAVAANMQRIGELIGICFQIKDDIFDYYQSDIGKPTGSDMREGKVTLPALYVLRTSANPSLAAIKDKLYSAKELDKMEIDLLIELSKNEGGVQYAMDVMDRLRDEAVACINLSRLQGCFRSLFRVCYPARKIIGQYCSFIY